MTGALPPQRTNRHADFSTPPRCFTIDGDTMEEHAAIAGFFYETAGLHAHSLSRLGGCSGSVC